MVNLYVIKFYIYFYIFFLFIIIVWDFLYVLILDIFPMTGTIGLNCILYLILISNTRNIFKLSKRIHRYLVCDTVLGKIAERFRNHFERYCVLHLEAKKSKIFSCLNKLFCLHTNIVDCRIKTRWKFQIYYFIHSTSYKKIVYFVRIMNNFPKIIFISLVVVKVFFCKQFFFAFLLLPLFSVEYLFGVIIRIIRDFIKNPLFGSNLKFSPRLNLLFFAKYYKRPDLMSLLGDYKFHMEYEMKFMTFHRNESNFPFKLKKRKKSKVVHRFKKVRIAKEKNYYQYCYYLNQILKLLHIEYIGFPTNLEKILKAFANLTIVWIILFLLNGVFN